MANQIASNYFFMAWSNAQNAGRQSGDPQVQALANAIAEMAMGLKALADER